MSTLLRPLFLDKLELSLQFFAIELCWCTFWISTQFLTCILKWSTTYMLDPRVILEKVRKTRKTWQSCLVTKSDHDLTSEIKINLRMFQYFFPFLSENDSNKKKNLIQRSRYSIEIVITLFILLAELIITSYIWANHTQAWTWIRCSFSYVTASNWRDME